MATNRALALISEGMLNGGKKAAITIASIGWLVLAGAAPSESPKAPPQLTHGGPGGRYHQEWMDKRKRLDRDNEEWMLFIKIFSEQCL